MSTLRHLVVVLVALLVFPAHAHAQYFELTPERDSATVGDVVTLHARLHIGIQQRLTEPVPMPVERLPDGMRLVSSDTLRRGADGAYSGAVKLAFYRPGPQAVPLFRVRIRLGGDVPMTMSHAPPTITIVPVLTPGPQELKDIRPLAPVGGMSPLPFVAAAALALLALFVSQWARRRRAAALAEPIAEPLPESLPPTPYERARARLEELARTGWAEHDVTRYYDAVADVLRDYFSAVANSVAPGTTAAELARLLAGHRRPEPLRRRTVRVFTDADLVKFASVRPDAPVAEAYLAEARAVLDGWSEAAAEPSGEPFRREDAGALR
jgi:hypothetical protein